MVESATATPKESQLGHLFNKPKSNKGSRHECHMIKSKEMAVKSEMSKKT